MKNLNDMKRAAAEREFGFLVDPDPDVRGNIRFVIKRRNEPPFGQSWPPARLRGVLLHARAEAAANGESIEGLDLGLRWCDEAIAEIERRQRVEGGNGPEAA